MSFYRLISPALGAPALSILLQSIINQYFTHSYCVTIVSEDSIDLPISSTFTYIAPNGTVEELKDQLLEVSEQGCSDYIVNMRDAGLFMTAFDIVSKSGNIRRSDRKVIFLPHPEANNSEDRSLDLFSMRETKFLANILMILPNTEVDSECDKYALVTHEFGRSKEGIDQPLYLDEWDSCTRMFKTNYNLFPNDMKNLNGKIVKVACFTYKPYVFLDLDPALAPSGRDGIEIRIVEEFCRWVNCIVEIVLEDKDQWGEIFENGTGIGVMGSVVEDRADMGISALYSWYEEFVSLDFSAACIRSAVTCLAPSPKLLASWEMPLMPFTLNMWFAVLITFLLASIGLIIAKGCSSDGAFLIVFGVMISQSQSKAESNWRVRRVTGWLLLTGLILVSAYGGGLASTFTVPKYEPSIDTVQDLVQRKMEWGATHDAWILSLTMSTEPSVIKLVSQFHIYPAEELKKRSFMRKMAFSLEKLPAGYFAIGDYITKPALRDMTLMLEDFYYEQCVVMMRKSSPYTEKMSALVGRLHQSGLLLAWETQVALKLLNYEVQQEVKLSRSRTDVAVIEPLNLRDVVGIFILYGIGVGISILLLVVEIYFSRFSSRF